MNDSFVWKTDRPWPNERLKTAAIIGHTTDTTTRFWLRTARLGDHTLLLYPLNMVKADSFHENLKQIPFDNLDALPDEVMQLNFTIADYDTDTTHVEDISGLSPLTEYGYALFSNDNGTGRIVLGHDRKMTFRTLPTTHDSMSFGFYSCHMPYKKTIFGNTNLVNIEMWDYFAQVLERHHQDDLRFVIGGGDQIYTDGVDSLNIWAFLNKVMRKEDGQLLPSKEDMLSWYRDIYRGYWGFPSLKKVFSSYPTYMIWDDHELADGWGSHILKKGKSDELDEIVPDWKEKNLTRDEVLTLVKTMHKAGVQVYNEYQHAHNPDSDTKQQFDYHYQVDSSAFYVLDGRGNRNINRATNRILGKAQLNRFRTWLEELDPDETPYVFIVSAVPMVHLVSVLANADENVIADLANLQDDLRDSWEHSLHDKERRAVLRAFFDAADRGLKVSVLSGDVHTSAVFKLTDDKTDSVIYQLTSSAITYNKPRVLSWLLGKSVADEGHSDDGYHFERLALYTDSNFSIVKVNKEEDRIMFQLYGKQVVADPYEEEEDIPMTHAMTKVELHF